MPELYKPSSTDSLSLKIAPRYEADLNSRISEKLWNAPFQFTIPLMGAMWFDLQEQWIKENAESWQFQNNGTHTVCKMPDLFAGEGARWGSLDPDLKATDESKKKLALKCPIRAIAYFSWEESGRVFLTRRVYPTFFNFCPRATARKDGVRSDVW